jgi:hypothetical protein
MRDVLVVWSLGLLLGLSASAQEEKPTKVTFYVNEIQ